METQAQNSPKQLSQVNATLGQAPRHPAPRASALKMETWSRKKFKSHMWIMLGAVKLVRGEEL